MNIILKLSQFLLSLLSRVHLGRVEDGWSLTVKRDRDGEPYLIVASATHREFFEARDFHDYEYLLRYIFPELGIRPEYHKIAMALLQKACGVSHKTTGHIGDHHGLQ